MTETTPLTDSSPSSSEDEASTPYLVWASVAAGAWMSAVWITQGAADTYLTTALVPLATYVLAIAVSLVRRDSLASRQLIILVVAVAVLMMFGSVVVLPLPWAVVTFAFLVAAAIARRVRLVILALASAVGILFNAWPSAYADAGPGLSIGALSAAIGAVALLVAYLVLSRR